MAHKRRRERERIYVSSLQKKMFRTAFFTAVFTEFTQIVALTIDAFIVCFFLGEKEIAAVGLASPFFFLAGIPATCFASGLQTVCSQEMGRGHVDEVIRKFSQTMIFVVCVMIAVTIAIFLCVPQLAFIFGARGDAAELAGMTSQYLYGLCLDAAPFVIMSVLIPAVILDNGSSTVVLSSVIGGIVNIVADLIMATGGRGLFGIGLASALSVIASLGILLTHFLKKGNVICFQRVPVRLKEIGEVVRLGMPNAVHSIAGTLRSVILNSLMVSIGGSIGMSVLTIHTTILDFVDINAVGIAGAVGVLTGMAFGEMNSEEVESVGVPAHHYIIASSVLTAAFLICFRRPIAGIFLNADSEGFSLLIFAIMCISAGSVVNGLIYCRVSYLQAIGKSVTAQKVEAKANFFCLIVLAFALSIPFGVHGPFLAFFLSKALVLVGIFFVYVRRSGKWLPEPIDYLGLKNDFFESPRDTIAYPVKSLEECILLSEQVALLCKGHKVSRQIAYYASLCAEEISTNVILHGYSRNQSSRDGQDTGILEKCLQRMRNKDREESPVLDVRVTITEDSLIMRFRDNGMAFNMNTLAKMLSESKDPFDKIGLRIICSVADKIDYYRIYGMNTTIIRIRHDRDIPLEKPALH